MLQPPHTWNSIPGNPARSYGTEPGSFPKERRPGAVEILAKTPPNRSALQTGTARPAVEGSDRTGHTWQLYLYTVPRGPGFHHPHRRSLTYFGQATPFPTTSFPYLPNRAPPGLPSQPVRSGVRAPPRPLLGVLCTATICPVGNRVVTTWIRAPFLHGIFRGSIGVSPSWQPSIKTNGPSD